MFLPTSPKPPKAMTEVKLSLLFIKKSFLSIFIIISINSINKNKKV